MARYIHDKLYYLVKFALQLDYSDFESEISHIHLEGPP